MGLQTCRICLAINVPMEFLGTTVKDFIEKIFHSHGYNHKLNEKHYCCLECKAHLVKCYNFIQKSLRAQKHMYGIISTTQTLTMEDIRNMDRHKLGLISNLSYHRVDEDFFVNELENELKSTIGPECDSKNKLISWYTEDEVGNDNECYLADSVIVKQEEIETVDDPTTNATITCIKYDYDIKPQSTKSSVKAKQVRLKTPPITKDNIILGCRKRNAKYAEADQSDDDSVEQINKRVQRKDKTPDRDYAPGAEESESSESGRDSCDDNGRTLKKPDENEREYPRKCDHCNYVIDVRNKHFKHYLYCHPDVEYPYHNKLAFMCSICGIRKRTVVTLRDHEATHGEKTVKCTNCPSMFHNRKYMLRHCRQVHSAILFYCDYCNKACKQKGELRLHIRTHTGEKPFKCHICGAAFAHRGNVGIHIRSAHQGEGNRGKNARKSKGRTRKKVENHNSDSES